MDIPSIGASPPEAVAAVSIRDPARKARADSISGRQSGEAHDSADAADAAGEPGRDAEATAELVAQANEKLKSSGAVLEYGLDPGTRQIVTKLVDSRTQEVIRQIPSETVLAIARSIDRVAGLLLNKRA